MSSPIRFTCTECGTCCRNRLIPLTLQESAEWLSRGHRVVLLTESFTRAAWQGSYAEYQHQKQRSFPVRSHEDELRVILILAGDALQGCPNLGEENRCGIYESRPHVCRIYPLEINPFIHMQPAAKSCPPQAWESGPVIVDDGAVVGLEDRNLIISSRRADYQDSLWKKRLRQKLGVDVAAWKGDGLMAWRFQPDVLLAALFDLDVEIENVDVWRVYTENEQLKSRLKWPDSEVDSGLPAQGHFYSLTG